MKKILLFSLLLSLTSLRAQEHLKPDTALMRKNKVHEVKVYYSNSNVSKSHYYSYTLDRRGRIVREGEATAGYHYEYRYDEQNRITSIWQRANNGTLTSRTDTRYIPGENYREVSHYMDGDTVNPRYVYHFENGTDQKLYEAAYYQGKLLTVRKAKFENGKCTWSYDSIISSAWVNENRDMKTIRQSQYAQGAIGEEHWRYEYVNDRLSAFTDSTPGNNSKRYTINYLPGKAEILYNGKALNDTERQRLVNKVSLARNLLEQAEEYPLPYSDPVPDYAPKHAPVFNKKGLMTSDKITGSLRSDTDCTYDYEYTFY